MGQFYAKKYSYLIYFVSNVIHYSPGAPGSDQRQEKASYGEFKVVGRNYGIFSETYEFDESILDLKYRIKKEWGILLSIK